MSNRFWYKNNPVAMCELTKGECLYPYGYCSVCPIDNSDGSHEKAQLWNNKRKPEVEKKRNLALKTLWDDNR